MFKNNLRIAAVCSVVIMVGNLVGCSSPGSKNFGTKKHTVADFINNTLWWNPEERVVNGKRWACFPEVKGTTRACILSTVYDKYFMYDKKADRVVPRAGSTEALIAQVDRTVFECSLEGNLLAQGYGLGGDRFCWQAGTNQYFTRASE